VTDIDHRQLGRDSLFLMADLRLDGQDGEHRVRVRNLSAGGMMAEGALRVMRGTRLQANLRHIGWVEGSWPGCRTRGSALPLSNRSIPSWRASRWPRSRPTITPRAMCAHR
jgi:hypothetical protein